MTRLVVTVDAETDTDEILTYLTREAGDLVADKYGRRLRVTIERLLDMPEMGAARPSLGPNARIAIVYPYVLVYDYTRDDDTLTLLRILHGRRRVTRDLLGR
jgi:toxin ParE1/3/4